jgi:hypothetical protein
VNLGDKLFCDFRDLGDFGDLGDLVGDFCRLVGDADLGVASIMRLGFGSLALTELYADIMNGNEFGSWKLISTILSTHPLTSKGPN